MIMVNTMWGQFTVTVTATDSVIPQPIVIGNVAGATNGVDTAAAIGETELPPKGIPGTFYIGSIGWGSGTTDHGTGGGLLVDKRAFRSAAQTDSFFFEWQVTTESPWGGQLKVTWPSGLASVGGGYWHLKDGLTGGTFFDVDMTKDTVKWIPSTIHTFWIIYGDDLAYQTVSYFRVMNERNQAGAYKATAPSAKKTPFVLPNLFTLTQYVDKAKAGAAVIGSDAVKSVTFKKVGDMLKSLYTLKTGGYHKSYNLHCLDSAYNMKWKSYKVTDTAGVKHVIFYPAPIAKQLKSLVPDTLKGAQNNSLFAQLTIAKINVLLNGTHYAPKTTAAIFPAGLSDYIVQGHSGVGDPAFTALVINAPEAGDALHPWHGQTVGSLIAKADSALSCVGAPSKTTLGELRDGLAKINASFTKATNDTGIYVTSVAKFDTASYWFHTGKVETKGWDKIYRIQGQPLATVGYLVRSLPAVAGGSSVPHAVAAGNQPKEYTLDQNYPNPFNPTTQISFNLIDKGFVTVKVFNMLGQEVATLVNHEEMSAGSREVTFDANDFASGAYFYRIVVNDEAGALKFQAVKKMMLVK